MNVNTNTCIVISYIHYTKNFHTTQVLVEWLQRVQTPEQHQCARRFRQFYMVMQKSWIGSERSEPMFACRSFQEWIEEMEENDKQDLVKLIKQECRSFASILVTVLRSRLRNYWQYIQVRVTTYHTQVTHMYTGHLLIYLLYHTGSRTD